MQTVFYSNINKQKAIKRKVKKAFKRWRTAFPISVLMVILSVIGACICMYRILPALSGGMYALSLSESLLMTAALALIFSIPALLVFAWASSGGRKIIMARVNERIILDNETIYDQFAFRFKNSTNITTDIAEYAIRYMDIREIVWNEEKQRLELYCDYTYGQYRQFSQGRSRDNYTSETVNNGIFYIYNYFDSMELLIQQLSIQAGKNIKGIC